MGVGYRKNPDSLSLPEAQSFMYGSSTSVVLSLQGSRTLSKALMKAGALLLRDVFMYICMQSVASNFREFMNPVWCIYRPQVKSHQ